MSGKNINNDQIDGIDPNLDKKVFAVPQMKVHKESKHHFRNIHYTNALKTKARKLYEDPAGHCYHSYKKVAKELGLPRFQTIGEWARKNNWKIGPWGGEEDQDVETPTNVLTEHYQDWSVIRESAGSILKSISEQTDPKKLEIILKIFREACSQRVGLAQRIHAIDLTNLSDNDTNRSEPKNKESEEKKKLFPTLS